MSFWGELKRRNVVKVGASYLVVAWLLAQVVDLVLPTFNAPAWVGQTIIFLLILGLPIILIVAWAFEITPEGIKSTSNVPKSESSAPVTGQRLNYLIITLLAFAVVFLLVDNYLLEDTDTASLVQDTSALLDETVADLDPIINAEESNVLPNSVAVLPFENLSPDPNNAYFAAGIHGAILNELAQLRNVNVIARTSVLQYADGQTPISEIAEALNVETVMEGSVQYADGRILVTAQLIDPETDAHLWSNNYDREFANIFAIQADIAISVARALEAEFSVEEQARLEREPTDSPAAYALYLQVRADLGDSDELDRALLDRAIELDSDFAQAYAQKALSYALSFIDSINSAGMQAADRNEVERNTRENAEKALSLDPGSGAAHNALGQLGFYTWRWTEAQRSFERGYAISGFLGGTYGWLNAVTGRRNEAIQAAERGVAQNPNEWFPHWALSKVYMYLGEYEASYESLRTAAELAPFVPVMHVVLAQIEIIRGDSVAALNELQIAERLMGDNRLIIMLPGLVHGYAQIGRMDDAQRVFDEIREIAVDREIGAGTWALAYLGIGDQARALEWLEVAAEKAKNHEVDTGFFNLMDIRMNVMEDQILEQPEFVDLRNRIRGD